MCDDGLGAANLRSGRLAIKLYKQHAHGDAGDERHQPERDQSRAKGVQEPNLLRSV